MALAGTTDEDEERQALVADVERLRGRFPRNPRRYLYILMAVGAVDAADRSILATVSEDVRRAFDVGDDEIGLLFGAYALVATLSALPFGFIADRWNRVWLIALGFVPWSIAMFWAGAAPTFAMMFVARLFLGSIEATNGPSTPSLLGDYYPVKERGRIFGIYGIGTLVGFLAGFAAAGVLATLFDWRTAFFVWGAMGLVCGLAVWRLLPEPARGVADALHLAETKLNHYDNPPPEAATPPPANTLANTFDYRSLSLWPAIREVARVKTMWIMFVSGLASEFFLSAIGTWAVTFFRRYHAFSAGKAGIVVALLALSAVGGIVFGARRSDKQIARGTPTRRILMIAVAEITAVGTIFVGFGLDNLTLAIPFLVTSAFLIGIPMGPANAVGLDIMVPHLRGRAAALRSVLRVVAIASAPILFGLLSENYGLRSAMLFFAPTIAIAGFVTLFAMRTYPRDMARCQAESLRQQYLEESSAVS